MIAGQRGVSVSMIGPRRNNNNNWPNQFVRANSRRSDALVAVSARRPRLAVYRLGRVASRPPARRGQLESMIPIAPPLLLLAPTFLGWLRSSGPHLSRSAWAGSQVAGNWTTAQITPPPPLPVPLPGDGAVSRGAARSISAIHSPHGRPIEPRGFFSLSLSRCSLLASRCPCLFRPASDRILCASNRRFQQRLSAERDEKENEREREREKIGA